MTIIKKTNIQYLGQSAEVVKDIKPNPFSKNFTPGYSWRVFDGCEGYHISKQAFETPEEAENSAKETIAKWTAKDNRQQREASAYAKLQNKVFATEEAAKRSGVEYAVRYTCDECGSQFWAMWRSKYSPAPVCPTCEDSSFIY